MSSATRPIEGMLQQRADDLDDMITATGTTFLGLTIQCARCHDHKFDPITQKDYYGLAGDLRGRQPCRARGRRTRFPGGAGQSRARGELAAIESAARSTEPLAHPGHDRPDSPMVNPRRNVDRFAPISAA